MSYLGLSAEAFRCLHDIPAAGTELLDCDEVTFATLLTRRLVRQRDGRWYLTAIGVNLRDADDRLKV